VRWKGVYGGRNEDAAVGGRGKRNDDGQVYIIEHKHATKVKPRGQSDYHNNPRQNLHAMSSISASNPLKNDADMISNVNSAG
jgi:hypothetical protein